MNTETDFEPALITYMFFLYEQNGGVKTLNSFYQEWSDKYYQIDDLVNGRDYE